MDLFADEAAWPQAASHVGVFKLYGGWIARDATDDQLHTVVSDLMRRGMSLGFEASPLVPTARCGDVEGFAGPAEGPTIVRRLAAAGATGNLLRFVGLDEPFAFGHLYRGRSACRWPAEMIAREVATYIRTVREVFPGLLVGDIEPLWAGVDPKELEDWIATFRRVTGSELPFFHLDVDFSRTDWPDAAKELERFCRKRGIPFGIIYIGQGDSDLAFEQAAEDRFVSYEAKAGGDPDQVVFQSWLDRPDRVLPETQPGTFTHLVDRYFRIRTRIDIAVEASVHAGSFRAGGTLADRSGSSVSPTAVRVSLTPLSGEGSLASYALSGLVPTGATRADVGFRVNAECGCAGRADLTLYAASYTQGGETANRVPNGDFGAGLSGWTVNRDRTAHLERNDRGAGWMLRVGASARESTLVNSSEFAISADRTYSVRFEARVAPVSVGSGYFSLVFLGPRGEIARERIAFAPESFDLGTAPTDQSGGFHLTFHPPTGGEFLVEAWFAGNDRLWPAYARATIVVPAR